MNTSNGRVEMMSICYGDNNQSYLLTQVLSSGGRKNMQNKRQR